MNHWDQEQRAAPRQSQVSVVLEVTLSGRALRSFGHMGGAQFFAVQSVMKARGL